MTPRTTAPAMFHDQAATGLAAVCHRQPGVLLAPEWHEDGADDDGSGTAASAR